MLNCLTLETLPVELLYEIQYHALSSSLPLASGRLYSVYKYAPPSVYAAFLIGRYLHNEHRARVGLVSVALRYPLCTQEILEAVFRSSECPQTSEVDPRMRTELPRRLFRDLLPRDTACQSRKRKRHDAGGVWTSDDNPLPFLRYLYSHPRIPRPYTDSYDGYALTKAVHVGFQPLIQFLLENGASPACKDSLAVSVAIRRKDLSLVRLLIERTDRRSLHGAGYSGSITGLPQVAQYDAGTEKAGQRAGKETKPLKSSKRRKLEDRVQVSQAMLKMAVKCDARDIVKYFMQEKGCVPDMRTVLMMGSNK